MIYIFRIMLLIEARCQMQIEPFLSRIQRNTSSSNSAFQTLVSKNSTKKKKKKGDHYPRWAQREKWCLYPRWFHFSLGQCTILDAQWTKKTFALKNKPKAEAHNTYWGRHSQANTSICLCFSVPSSKPLPLWAPKAEGASAAFISCLLLCSPISLSERSSWAQPPTLAKLV